jgi:hypothetical protein
MMMIAWIPSDIATAAAAAAAVVWHQFDRTVKQKVMQRGGGGSVVRLPYLA